LAETIRRKFEGLLALGGMKSHMQKCRRVVDSKKDNINMNEEGDTVETNTKNTSLVDHCGQCCSSVLGWLTPGRMTRARMHVESKPNYFIVPSCMINRVT